MTDLDLDALERWAQKLLADQVTSDDWKEAARIVLDLIQRLRKAEATDYFARAEHYESLYVAALNRATAAEARIARLEWQQAGRRSRD